MNPRNDTLIAMGYGALFGLGIGFALSMFPMSQDINELHRKAVASHAAYWKPDPGTGKPVLVWAREEGGER